MQKLFSLVQFNLFGFAFACLACGDITKKKKRIHVLWFWCDGFNLHSPDVYQQIPEVKRFIRAAITKYH